MKLRLLSAIAAFVVASPLAAAPVVAPPAPLGPDVQPYVSIPAGQIALTHVRVIDGTGAAAMEDMTVLIEGARIGAVQAASAPIPAGYRTIDGTGETVIPGIVGMHNHLFYLQRPNIDASGHSGMTVSPVPSIVR
jgi:imidazolonepropionase-like amidohydrolase